MNVTEIHYKIDLGLQGIDSARSRFLEPIEKDYYFNQALLRYVDTKLNPRSNARQEGFDKTTKRLDDLRELIRTYNSEYIYESPNTSYLILPYNYYHLTDCQNILNYSCNRTEKYKFSTLTKDICKVYIPTDTVGKTTTDKFYYTNLKLTLVDKNNVQTIIFNSTNYPELLLYSYDSKFMLLSAIKSVLSSQVNNFDLYFENYLGYNKDTIIFKSKQGEFKSVILSYDTTSTITSTFNFINESKEVYNELGNHTSSYELISSENRSSLINNNYYCKKNRHLKPYINIIGSQLYINNTFEFIPIHGTISYISTPIFINYMTDVTTNLQSNIQEVINICVELINYDLVNSIESQLRKSLKSE